MLSLQIICVSNRPASWVSEAADDYEKRLGRAFKVKLTRIAPQSKEPSVDRRRAKEAQRIRETLLPGSLVVVLDDRGTQWTTHELSKSLTRWREQERAVSFIIGGADGIAPELAASANQVWSLSKLTLPHQLVRVLLVEQLYRAYSVTQNHPYHRD